MNNNNSPKKSFKDITLSPSTVSIILGSILGDGSLKLYAPYKNARLSLRQSIKQESYIKYKVAALKEISSVTNKTSGLTLQNPSGFSKNKKYLYISATSPDLTIIHEQTYKNNKLNILRKWTNLLTPLALCIWWLDDGSIIAKGRQGVICTDGFELESIHILVRTLEVNWGIKSTILSVKKKYKDKESIKYRILFNRENLEKWLRIILPYIPVKEMLYKGIIVYNDNDLQQRWISEMKLLIKDELKSDLDQILKHKFP